MNNFSKLDFKNYLDAHENRLVWEAPRLIIQIDSLMRLWSGSEGSFKKAYDMIILDDSECLLAHIDEKTMERKKSAFLISLTRCSNNAEKSFLWTAT